MIYILVSIISLIASSIFWYLYFNLNNLKTVDLVLAASLLIVGLFSLFLWYFIKNKKRIKDLLNQIEVWGNTTYHISAAGDQAFEALPIGIVAYDENFIIKWTNSYAKKCFPLQLLESELNVIDSHLKDFCLSSADNYLIERDGKHYRLTHSKDINIIYFFDVTNEEVLKRRYNNRITAVGYIAIDNLEESLKRYDFEDKSTISGKILGEIATYLSGFDAYIQTVDEYRFMFICDLEHLDKMIADKFSILSIVREIALESHVRTSISIGVAAFDTSLLELGKLAEDAIELAEKRGGDQGVINIQGRKIQYIGGVTNALEKNTLVEARMQTNALKDAYESASNVLIMAHDLADCDAFGAMVGIYRLLKAFNEKKDIKIVAEENKLEPTVKKIYHFLETEDSELFAEIVDSKKGMNLLEDTSLLVVCDTQSPKISMFPQIVEKAKHLAIIDHHRVGDVDFTNVEMSYVETYSSSTVELVSEMMFFTNNVNLMPFEATIMLAGIIVDTNNFIVRTGTRTFDAASSLKERGADVLRIKELLRDNIEQEKVLAKAILNATLELGRFAIYELEDTITDRTILAKVADRLLNIEEVDAAFAIAKLNNDEVAISSRCLQDINVQTIMEEMGGGGHLQSAATQMKNISLAEAKEQLVNILKRDYGMEGEEKMKVILIADVKGKGKKDDIIEVNNGYGNYLLTNNLAVVASDENKKKLAEEQKQAQIDAQNRRSLLEKLKQEIENKTVTIYLKQGADGKLFGHVTTKLVCEEFEAQNGIRLDKRKLELPTDINSIGIYTATITLDKNLIASFQVNILGC